jgi:hypothetical protein
MNASYLSKTPWVISMQTRKFSIRSTSDLSNLLESTGPEDLIKRKFSQPVTVQKEVLLSNFRKLWINCPARASTILWIHSRYVDTGRILINLIWSWNWQSNLFLINAMFSSSSKGIRWFLHCSLHSQAKMVFAASRLCARISKCAWKRRLSVCMASWTLVRVRFR